MKKEKHQSIKEAEQIKEMKKTIKELNEKYLRLYAEFDNYRKRTEKETMEKVAYANEKLIVKLLSIIDNFELALASCSEEDKKTAFFEGMKLILKNTIDVLEKEGVIPMNIIGKKFNHHHHEAIDIIEKKNNANEKEELLEVQKGYTYKDKVIRAAKVKVIKKS